MTTNDEKKAETKNNKLIESIVTSLVDHFDEVQRFRIERGVSGVAHLWTEADGDSRRFESFCRDNFIPSGDRLNQMFDKLDEYFETLDGHFNSMSQDLQMNIHLDRGKLTEIDNIFGSFDVASHLDDDLFKNKIAFQVLLNFPRLTLEEKNQQGADWSHREWGEARLGDKFLARVPAGLQQELSDSITAGETYIANYNIHLGNLIGKKKEASLFPGDLVLISHWGLRDELKSHYAGDDGLQKQEIIHEVMKRIIAQEIPTEAINNPDTKWNPFDNVIVQNGQEIPGHNEPNDRYQHILNIFHSMQKLDTYYPEYPTYLRRKFDLDREIAEGEIVNLFSDLLSSSQLSRVGSLIEKRLGRKLKPFDIWYDGFKARSTISGDELDKMATDKYPKLEDFAHGIEKILCDLDFPAERAKFIAPKIAVDPARGAGHAWGAQMRQAVSRLRTRVPKSGMDYKGFNIAAHELGHCVEQTISLQNLPYHLNEGVPTSGFSEAFAFIFQDRDLDMLGVSNNDNQADSMKTLDIFWGTAEIMAVSLVDIKIWNWLYNNPKASAEELKGAVISAANEIWNRFFANIFGSQDETILGIYSHMIAYPLYLAEYPLGHLIQFQIEKHIAGKKLGEEMERICSAGNILPQMWMQKAVGENISIKPMLSAVDDALEKLKR